MSRSGGEHIKKISINYTSFSVSYILREIEILRFAQNDIFCHPERSEGSSWVISEKLVLFRELIQIWSYRHET
jgi:hypothetical protein